MFLYVFAAVALLIAGYVAKKRFLTKPKRKRSKVDAIVISGPSGVGKGTIIKRLLDERKNDFAFSVSHTSRAPREGEVNGVSYHFVEKSEMQAMVSRGEFLECCEVHGNMYGTSRKALREVQLTGKVPIIEIDVQGAQKLKTQQGTLNFYYLFIAPPSLEELEKRIVGRGQETPAKVQDRLKTAKQEMDFVEKNPKFFDRILKNEKLDETMTLLHRLFKLYCGL